MSGWEVRFSNSRQAPYYYNPQTKESIWEPPRGLTPQQISTLPGADRYLPGGGGGAAAGAGGAGAGGPPGQVRASHILAKHVGSRRPSSWREDNITRSPAQAREIIKAHIKHLEGLSGEQRAAEFAKIASTESDCSSAKKGGDLGWFGRKMMQKSFEDATYALEVGQLSPIVESDSGIHVILRTG